MSGTEVPGLDRTIFRSALERFDLRRRNACGPPRGAHGRARRACLRPDAMSITDALGAKVAPGEQMLVESDQLVYDYDNNTVSAVGNVRIYYGGYTLEAEKVTYNRRRGRLIATGRVKLTDPTGAAYLFRAVRHHRRLPRRLRRVAACRDGRPDLFRRRARRARGWREDDLRQRRLHGLRAVPGAPGEAAALAGQGGQDRRRPQGEDDLFRRCRASSSSACRSPGCPTSRRADPSVKRKTGFLCPPSAIPSTLGWMASAALFLGAGAELRRDLHADATDATGLPGRGRVAAPAAERPVHAADGRHRPAGSGRLPEDERRVDPAPTPEDWRGGIRTTGEFDYNKQWSYGWDVTAQSDRTFTRNYGVLNDERDFATFAGASDRAQRPQLVRRPRLLFPGADRRPGQSSKLRPGQAADRRRRRPRLHLRQSGPRRRALDDVEPDDAAPGRRGSVLVHYRSTASTSRWASTAFSIIAASRALYARLDRDRVAAAVRRPVRPVDHAFRLYPRRRLRDGSG